MLRLFVSLVVGVVMMTLGVLIFQFTGRSLGLLSKESDKLAESKAGPAQKPIEQLYLSPQAQKNWSIISKPLTPQTFYKTISIPGIIIDRPGWSDRGVVSPVTGVVEKIHRHPGEIVEPGEILITIRLLSESVHQAQSELIKLVQDIKIADSQLSRLKESLGAIPEAKIVEIENQLSRLKTIQKSLRQELSIRGITPEQMDQIAAGNRITEIDIRVPTQWNSNQTAEKISLEMHDLRVDLGQQVQAGQLLCYLANHQLLAIEGEAFHAELPWVEKCMLEEWPVEVDYNEEEQTSWRIPVQKPTIHHISNIIDPDTRAFHFDLWIENDFKKIQHEDRSQLLWRYRPGQRVTLKVRTEKLENVFVLPRAAIAKEGANVFLFRQNGDVYDRKPVHLLYQDFREVVIANDGSIPAGIYVAQSNGNQLQRMLKSQSNSTPKGFHIHADGSIHYGSDE